MGIFRRKDRGATAVAEAEPEVSPVVAEARALEADGKIFEGIDLLTRANRESGDVEVEREIIAMRHRAGAMLVEAGDQNPSHPEPAADYEFRLNDRVPEVTPDELTPEILRAAILKYGCLKVTGVMDEATAASLADDIDHAFEIRGRLSDGKEVDPTRIYEEFQPREPYQVQYVERHWVALAGGVLAADSPKMFFEMVDSLEQAGVRDVVEGYLGERAAISAQKCTLRKADPSIKGGWHQDGKFLGDVRALNVWLSLSRCGDVAPSMDIVPVRLDDFVAAGVNEGDLHYQVTDETAEEAAGETGVVRPIFNPGDVLLFDEMFLHQTGSDPSMPNPRYAIESWFFGPSAFPEEYAPIAF